MYVSNICSRSNLHFVQKFENGVTKCMQQVNLESKSIAEVKKTAVKKFFLKLIESKNYCK